MEHLPLPFLTLNILGWIQTFCILAYIPLRQSSLENIVDEATASDAGARHLLLWYRAAVSLYCLVVGVPQLARLGFAHLFRFMTLWNWWLLNTYFAMAALCSFLSLRSMHSGKANTAHGPPAGHRNAGALRTSSPSGGALQAKGKAAAAGDRPGKFLVLLAHACLQLFHVNLAMVLVTFVVTWGALAPAAHAEQDDAERDNKLADLYNWGSANQHGINVLLMCGELWLTSYPATFRAAGWLSAWCCCYGLFATCHFLLTGRFVYPFMSAPTSQVWAICGGILALLWGGFGAALWLVQRREHARRCRVGLNKEKVK